MIKVQNGKVYQQHEMMNMAHCNMIDYFESYVRNKNKKKVSPDSKIHYPRRVLTEATNNFDYQDPMIESDKKELFKRKEFQTPRSPEQDTLQRIQQSKIILTGSKKIAKHIQCNNIIDGSPKREMLDGQKEIYQKIRECFTFIPHQNLVQDKKLIPSMNILKRKEEEEKRTKPLHFPSISQNNIDSYNVQTFCFISELQQTYFQQQPLQNFSERKSTTINSRKRKLEEKPLQINVDLRKFTSQKIDNDLLTRKYHTDVENIQLDSINIMNSSSFKNIDFSEIQKQGVILQAERQQMKEAKKVINQQRGYDRLNFVSRRQKSQASHKEPFIGLLFQDYENYTPIHSNCSRRTPIVNDIDQSHSIDMSQSYIETNQNTISYKRTRQKRINHSFF